MLLSDSILRNMLCSGRIVAVDIALWWTIVRFWLQSTHSTFFCASSGKQPFPTYGSLVSLCVMRIMIVNAWGLNPGLQLPSWGTSDQALNLHLENEDCDTSLRPNLQFTNHGLHVEHLSALPFALDLIYPSFPQRAELSALNPIKLTVLLS